jgi:hypothetical protein
LSNQSRQCALFARSLSRLPHSHRILALSLRLFPRTGSDDLHAEEMGTLSAALFKGVF